MHAVTIHNSLCNGNRLRYQALGKFAPKWEAQLLDANTKMTEVLELSAKILNIAILKMIQQTFTNNIINKKLEDLQKGLEFHLKKRTEKY